MPNIEKEVVTKIATLLPNYDALDVYADISDRSHSIEFFATIKGKRIQCYDLADQGVIQEKQMDKIFREIADYIRTTEQYKPGKMNTFSFSSAQ